MEKMIKIEENKVTIDHRRYYIYSNGLSNSIEKDNYIYYIISEGRIINTGVFDCFFAEDIIEVKEDRFTKEENIINIIGDLKNIEAMKKAYYL